MTTRYQPSQFEKKWAETWYKNKDYKASEPDGKHKKQFIFPMFPYPSGAGLHVGHVRVYTGTDIVARYYRMNQYSVLHPIGWDAFGLPAENAAIKAKKNPMDMVPDHIATFKRQMISLGFSFDWDRELATTDPNYYKWTQWLFIQFYKMGLLYKKNTPINYCPTCKTGLAEEEVLPNGTHERCGNKIEKRDLPQWVFKITKYADRLLSDLEGLDWPKGILEMQRNWIGRKEGINIDYKVKNSNEIITCFTTAPVNFGMTFIVISPEHEFIKKIIKGEIKVPKERLEDIKKYAKSASEKTEQERLNEGREKTGVFTGLYAYNPVAEWDVPIWITDFVLANVGTGAVQGCPGHDYKDFEFAKKFKLPIIRVVVGEDGDMSEIKENHQVIIKGMKGKMVNSKFLNGFNFSEGLEKTMDYIEEKGWGKRVTTYHLRDWIFSRQRYWGEPIPMINCEKCGWQTLPEDQLPLKLPYVKSYEPTESGESPLSVITEFVNTACPKCGGKAKRETDTMPNWAGSCWYFLRFADPKNDKQAWSPEAMKKWMPTDWYVGGAEHAVLHLLYARFWVKALYDLKLLDFKEPFTRLRNLGMILAEDHQKMSKSFGNVINPDDVIKEYGADALRVYEMFMAPFDAEIAWSTKSLQGSYRFVKRIWDIYQQYQKLNIKDQKEDEGLVVKLKKTIQKVTSDIPGIKFNTAIAMMMEFLNDYERNPQGLSKENAKKFLQILAPFAPYMTEEIWKNIFKEKTSIHLSVWPTVSGEIVEEEVILPVQINGKLRDAIKIQRSNIKDQKAIEELVMKSEKVKKYITGKPKKIIYISGKIINFIM